MHRGGLGAVLMLIVSTLAGGALLLRLGHLSWLACFSPDQDAPPFVLRDEALTFGLCTLPWIPFALVHLLARDARIRRWNLLAFLLMSLLVLSVLLPPLDSQHDCDRKGGSDAGFFMIIALPISFLAAILTQLVRLALNAGKPIHD